jgi:hypothetical protein
VALVVAGVLALAPANHATAQERAVDGDPVDLFTGLPLSDTASPGKADEDATLYDRVPNTNAVTQITVNCRLLDWRPDQRDRSRRGW